MDIKELESILAVYRHKSFSEAAYQTDFSLSAISKHVSRVENELGIKLFERKTKAEKMKLTPEGEQILPAIERVLIEYENLQWQVGNCKTEKQGSISIGYPPLVGTLGENAILSDFMANNPNVEVLQVLLVQKELLRLLLSGKLDGIFMLLIGSYEGNREFWGALEKDELSVFPIMRHRKLWIGLSEEHPLAKGDSVDLTDLKDETFIFSTAQNPMYFATRIQKVIQLSGVESENFKVRYVDFIQRQVVLDLVARGCGVLPQAVLPQDKHEGVRFLPVKNWDVESHGLFVCRKSNTSRALQKFRHSVESYVQEQI